MGPVLTRGFPLSGHAKEHINYYYISRDFTFLDKKTGEALEEEIEEEMLEVED